MVTDALSDGRAIYFDGQTNRKRSVVLRFSDDLEIVEQDAVIATWPYGDVRRIAGPANARLRLGCVTAPMARLEAEDDATKVAIVSRCPSFDAGRTSGTQIARIVFWSLAAACSIVLLAVYAIPFAAERLAPFVPRAWETRVGEAIDPQVRIILGGKVCSNRAGESALGVLIDALKNAGDVDSPLDVNVLSSNLPNAFALPGGKIYLLDGLLQKAQSPDEIAGILAHELGHIKHRDSLRKLIQTGGTSFLFGVLFGDVTGAGAVLFAARSILDASYSREAESAADAFASETMRKLGRSASPMAELLLRVTGQQANRSLTILASHPLTEERLAAMKKDERPTTGDDLLSTSQWRALKAICRP